MTNKIEHIYVTEKMNPFKFQRFMYERDGDVFANRVAISALAPGEDTGCGKNREELLKWLDKLSYMSEKIQIRNAKNLVKKTQKPQKVESQMNLFQ